MSQVRTARGFPMTHVAVWRRTQTRLMVSLSLARANWELCENIFAQRNAFSVTICSCFNMKMCHPVVIKLPTLRRPQSLPCFFFVILLCFFVSFCCFVLVVLYSFHWHFSNQPHKSVTVQAIQLYLGNTINKADQNGKLNKLDIIQKPKRSTLKKKKKYLEHYTK